MNVHDWQQEYLNNINMIYQMDSLKTKLVHLFGNSSKKQQDRV